MKLLLASRSPRRKQLLEWCGFELEVAPSFVDETWDPTIPPEQHARQLAAGKAAQLHSVHLILAADTVVHRDGLLFDMPTDRHESASHLRNLSGNWHTVTTGVCIRRGNHSETRHVNTEVRFRDLSTTEITRYVASGEGDDKAGAYAIQGIGGALIAEIRGSWTNVMGLPVEETLEFIESAKQWV